MRPTLKPNTKYNCGAITCNTINPSRPHQALSCSSMFGSELSSRQSATWQQSPVRLTPPLPTNQTAEGRLWARLLFRVIQSQWRESTLLARPCRGTCIPACKLPLGGERKCLENICGQRGKDSRYETHLCRVLFRSLSWNIKAFVFIPSGTSKVRWSG